MKTISHRLSSLLAAICSSLLSLLGFSSCSNPEDVPDMYGMPVGDFEIKGAVTDEAGKNIENAEIRVTYPDAPSNPYSITTVTTDAEGRYKLSGRDLLPEAKVVCIPEQSDLKPDSVIVKLQYKNPDKHNSWDLGHAKETVNFTLKTKQTVK